MTFCFRQRRYLFAALTVFGIWCLIVGACRGQWVGIDYYPAYNFFSVSNQPNEICSFDFPTNAPHAHYPAFLVRTNEASLIDCALHCELDIEASPDAVFRYGGQGTWNTGTLPANVRFYFSTVSGYNNNGPETNYWFNSQWAEVKDGTITLNATLSDHTGWTDGQGHSDSNAFYYVASNIRRVGLALGGGNFDDIGIATTNGMATLHLKVFEIVKQLRMNLGTNTFLVTPSLSQCFYQQIDGVIYKSTNLIQWQAL